MDIKLHFKLWLFLGIATLARAEHGKSYYADINDDLLNFPFSAAMAGSDMSFSSGASPSSTPANLPFDSINTLSLSYANYFQNSFSTSLLSYTSKIGKEIGYGITAGYIYLPDIEITEDLETDENGNPVYIPEKVNCSRIFFRMALGKSFSIFKTIDLAIGSALDAERNRLPEYRGYGIGLDLGAKVLFKRTGVSLALLFENAIVSLTYWSSSYYETAYPHLRIGVGWDRYFPYIYGNIRIGYTSPDILSNEGINYIEMEDMGGDVKIEKPSYQKVYENPLVMIVSGKFGLEYRILERLSLRGGITQGRFSFGAGLNMFGDKAGLDFAYATHSLAGTYQLSMSYRW